MDPSPSGKYVTLYSPKIILWKTAGSADFISHFFLLKMQIPKCLFKQELHDTHFAFFVLPSFHFLIISYSHIKGRAIPKYCILDLFNISFNSSTFLAPPVTIIGIFTFSANLIPISAYIGFLTYLIFHLIHQHFWLLQ